MPRNHIPGASTLRNRNRITNKSRLKIVKGNVDADDLLFPDEDEEKHRLTNLVAGVDAEDANEHHLQEVLSVAHRAAAQQATKKAEEKVSIYIPTPDSTGVADNWEQLYPSNVWKDPATYVASSTTVEESTRDGLSGGFSYFMDERDKEWLDKNNEEARGEGTSAQGAISASGTRTSARSAKAKGKEPDLNQPVVISEDEFELAMGLFEKVTHEKTEFLHHSLETGMPFPSFAEYQETFSSPLTPASFASHFVPAWIPQPQQLLRIARTTYPYWKERRVERAGHRITPTLNFDESDTLNESYICFRRREIKAVRKTRQAQVSSSDKLVRLQAEFAYPLELARHVLQRETIKREQAVQAQLVWQRRMALADLKRKFPSLSDKTDEELLVDKERPAKRLEPPRLPGVKIPANSTSIQPLRPDPVIKPRERIASVREKTDTYLARRKEEDKAWEDVVDNPQQTPYAPYACKLFKFIPPPASSSEGSDKTAESDDERSRPSRAVRMRYGRGGRLVLDRRDFAISRHIAKRRRTALLPYDSESDEDPEEVYRRRRLEERWRFDADDAPSPPTSEEDSRILINECDSKYLRHTMTLLTDRDHIDVTTDPSLVLPMSDGRQQTFMPYRLGMPQIPRVGNHGMRPPSHLLAQAQAAQAQAQAQAQSQANGGAAAIPNAGMPGTPVSIPLHLKKMPPPTAIPTQMRISSNGGMRPSVTTPGLQVNGTGLQQSPPQPVPLPTPQHAPANGGGRAAIAMPHVDMVKPAEPPMTNGTPPVSAPDTIPAATEAAISASVPPRPKSQNQGVIALPNGFHAAPANSAAAFAAANYQQQLQNAAQNGVNGVVDLQKLPGKNAVYASMTPHQLATLQAPGGARVFAQNLVHNVNGVGVANGVQGMQIPANLKLPGTGAVRQLQWTLGAGLQRSGSAQMNGVSAPTGDPNGIPQPAVVNGVAGNPASGLAHLIPVRSPSTNGMRPGIRVASGGVPQHTPSPMPNIAQTTQQSPPRHPMTATGMSMASPPIQHQQPVGGTPNGY